MPSLNFVAALACLAGLFSVATAATSVKLVGGVCGSFPGAFPDFNTGWSRVGDTPLRPFGTGTYIDNLDSRWGSIKETARGTLPWETVSCPCLPGQIYTTKCLPTLPLQVALHNDSSYASYPVECVDDQGFRSGGKPIRINTLRDSTLVTSSFGLITEPYNYYIDGVQQPGIYIGAAGEVRWAWKNRTVNNIMYWQPRLMVVTTIDPQADVLREGEVQGFLVSQR